MTKKEHEITTDKATIYLECRLTEEELKAASKALADAVARKGEVESRFDTFRAQIKAELAGFDACIQKNSSLVNNEKEFRDVKCEVQFDWTDGTKNFVRLDSGEVIRTEAISNDERQMHFAHLTDKAGVS